MNKILMLILLGLSISGCGKKPENDLTVFGDSISFGYYADKSYTQMLADEWNLSLVNLSVSSTTIDSSAQIGAVRGTAIKPGGRILYSPGINDALRYGTDATALSNYQTLLTEILDKFEASGSEAYVGGPLLTQDANLNAAAEAYANILVQVLNAKNYQHVHLINARGKFSPRNEWMNDAVHPNSYGHKEIFAIFNSEIR